MDLDLAIDAHVEWKTKFRQAIAARSELDAATIGKDDRCPLGKWLHGAARAKYGHMADYTACVDAHAAFHREAGRVAGLINQKNFAGAEAAIGASAAFSEASTAAVARIRRLKASVAA